MGTIIFEYVGKIYDSIGKLVYEFPAATLLDRILPELWLIVKQYFFNDKIFGIGQYSSNYSGYHLITRSEINKRYFQDIFTNYYVINRGIHSLSSTSSIWINGDNFVLKYENLYIRKQFSGETHKITFKTTKVNSEEIIRNFDKMEYLDIRIPQFDDNGLFVSNDLIFD